MPGHWKSILFLAAVTWLWCTRVGENPAWAASPPETENCRLKLVVAGKSEPKGIYFLDEKRAGPIPDEFEAAPGPHRLTVLFEERAGTQEKWVCKPGQEKELRLKPGKEQPAPAWVDGGARFQNSGEELFFEGVGASTAWGPNAWVQVLLADLRGRMDIVRTMDNQTASLRRDYEQNQDYHLQNASRSVILFSWDPGLVAARFQVEDRWLSAEGVLYSRVTLRLPGATLSKQTSSPTCGQQGRLVFFHEMLDQKTLDQVAILCGPGEGGFGDLAQALSGSEGEVWSAKDRIAWPEGKSLCIGDIQRLGRCTKQGADYVESIGLYLYPALIPVGLLHKDYSSENPYGCEFR